MILPHQVLFAISQLEASGFRAYAVGGCVRDSLMGRVPSDWDVTTSALPSDIQAVFSGFKTIPTGIRHGTVTVLIGQLSIEITTFRIDGCYEDNRHPKEVTFSKNLTEDLKRRDFTINAIAYNPSEGTIDPFGGIRDIEKKVIRTVGDPEKRFSEDALRIMRAIRFSSTLGFDIAPETSAAMFRCKKLLSNIAAERIAAELNKTATACAPADIIEKYFPILAPRLFSGLLDASSFPSGKPRLFEPMNAVPPLPVPRLSLFVLCAAEGLNSTPERVSRELFNNLKYDNATRKKVLAATENQNLTIPADTIVLRRLVRDMGTENLQNLLTVKSALSPQGISEAQLLFDAILRRKDCCTVRDLCIKGSDLSARFNLSGKEIGKALHRLLDAVIEEKCENKKEALIEYLKKN